MFKNGPIRGEGGGGGGEVNLESYTHEEEEFITSGDRQAQLAVAWVLAYESRIGTMGDVWMKTLIICWRECNTSDCEKARMLQASGHGTLLGTLLRSMAYRCAIMQPRENPADIDALHVNPRT